MLIFRSRSVAACGLFVALSFVGARASAECALPADNSPRARLAAASFVFLGDVESVEVIQGPETFRYVVRFRVIESFKGTASAQQALSGLGSDLNEFQFQKGQRVLVYAHGPAEAASTACSRTKVASLDDGELSTLREVVRQP